MRKSGEKRHFPARLQGQQPTITEVVSSARRLWSLACSHLFAPISRLEEGSASGALCEIRKSLEQFSIAFRLGARASRPHGCAGVRLAGKRPALPGYSHLKSALKQSLACYCWR